MNALLFYLGYTGIISWPVCLCISCVNNGGIEQKIEHEVSRQLNKQPKVKTMEVNIEKDK